MSLEKENILNKMASNKIKYLQTYNKLFEAVSFVLLIIE